jgi:hypothetical protein
MNVNDNQKLVTEEEFNKIKLRLNKAEKRLSNIEPRTLEKTLIKMDERADYLSSRLQLIITKITVATELCFLARQSGIEQESFIALKIIRCFDNDDEWWRGKKEYTLAEWFDVISEQVSAHAR